MNIPTYKQLRNSIKRDHSITDAQLEKAVKYMQMWHNPLNFSNGEDIKQKYGFSKLFTDWLQELGLGKRYYFRFHDYDMTNADEVLRGFITCENWHTYAYVVKNHAPKGMRSERLFLLALVEMTVRGFKHEKEVVEKLSIEYEVIISTPEEDLAGVDAWVDGRAVQIKSPATQAAMDSMLF